MDYKKLAIKQINECEDALNQIKNNDTIQDEAKATIITLLKYRINEIKKANASA